MDHLLFNLHLSKSEADQLKILLKKENSYNLNTSQKILFTIEDFSLSNTNPQKDAMLLTFFSFIQNNTAYEPYDLLDNLANEIWNKSFSEQKYIEFNNAEYEPFTLDDFLQEVISKELDKIIYKKDDNKVISNEKTKKLFDFFKPNNDIREISKDDLIECINGKIDDILIYTNLQQSNLNDKEIKAIITIYFVSKLNYISKLIKLRKYKNHMSFIKGKTNFSKLTCFEIASIDKLHYAKIHEMEEFYNNTNDYLLKTLNNDDFELLGFNSDHFKTLYENHYKIFNGNFKKVHAHKYKITNNESKVFFIPIELYLTKIALIKTYNNIEDLLHIFKAFRRNGKDLPLSICDDKILNLHNFNNIFPKKLMNTYLTIIYSLYLKSNYDDTRIVLAKLLLDRSKRIKPTEFAPFKENKNFENMRVSLKPIIEYINNKV